jgi:HEAT repeat protein
MLPRRALVLAAALFALACRGGDLDSPEPERRAAAVRALGADAELPVLLVAQRDPSALVRRAVAEAFAARGGAGAAEALGAFLLDPDAEVAAAAARGLAGAGAEARDRAREDLVRAYGAASPAARAAIADALDALGVSLREAVEAEARALWERNVTVLAADAGQARAGAAEEVGASARAEAVKRLLPLVDPNRNPYPALAAAAARGLAEAGDFAARPFLEMLLETGDVLTAEAAAAALGRLGDPAAAAPLALAAAGRPSRIASAAADALATLPAAPEVGAALCGVALRTRDPAVAARAARAAAARETDCSHRQLVARLGRGGASAIAALAELGPAGPQITTRVAALLDPSRADVATRTAAARFLARTGDAAAAPAVARRAATLAERAGEAAALAPEEAEELGALLFAAGRLRAEGADALLRERASDPLPAVRAGAVDGLAQLGARGAVERVAAALEDPDLRVRLVAADALGRQGTRGTVALAKACAAGRFREAEWRIALSRALGEAGGAEAVPALAALLDGPAAPSAASALARTGAPGAAGLLAAYLARPEATARAEAIEALAALGANDTAPIMAAQLTHDRPEVRAAAARALGKVRYEPASARLEALRSDYYGRVRRAAVEALAKLPAGNARPRP